MSKHTPATPKTLVEAITNGLMNARTVIMMPDEAEALAREVETHARDFLAQRFAAAFLKHAETSANEPLNELWDKITRKAE